MAEAILANKSLRKPPSGTAFYVVDVTCSNCWHVAQVGYAGWTALVCFRCGYQMDRTRYRCTNKTGADAMPNGNNGSEWFYAPDWAHPTRPITIDKSPSGYHITQVGPNGGRPYRRMSDTNYRTYDEAFRALMHRKADERGEA